LFTPYFLVLVFVNELLIFSFLYIIIFINVMPSSHRRHGHGVGGVN